MDAPYRAVAQVLSTYLGGLYESDTAKLKEVLHPLAHYASATDGELPHLGMDAHFPIVERRPSPASRGEARNDRIESIEFAGPVTAFARVKCTIGPKRFTDFLILIFVEGRWRIISKVFHYDLRGACRAKQTVT